MRAIQAFHMDKRNFRDIGYSFVVDPHDLAVYEARGAGIEGGHTAGHNRSAHAICVMGNFETQAVSAELVAKLAELVAYGHGKGWWPDRFTGGHRDVASTACPGRHLYAQIPSINARVGSTPVTEGTITLPANRDETIRRIQRAVGVVEDGDPYVKTAAAVEEVVAEVARLQGIISQVRNLTAPRSL